MYIHIPDANRQKLDAKGRLCIFVGYCGASKAYRGWDPIEQKIKISRDVLFDEQPHLLPLWIKEGDEQPNKFHEDYQMDDQMEPTPNFSQLNHTVLEKKKPSEQPTKIMNEDGNNDNNQPLTEVIAEPP
ncbi:uncharacterized protein LOC116922362 [Daphnia magna]|uniref:uncharacterized protein LOC116922362 n=1 Tax=Daphnia magna TaxID=35525 RepID=UPI0014020827|nr:uncharacterized protein LOC116922362 [Daphnia magna]